MTGVDARYLPVVALDVDGVLRVASPQPGAAARDCADGFLITMSRERYPVSEFHRTPEWDEHGLWSEKHWFSAVGAGWVRGLLKRGVTVVWATTWEEAANTYFAPLLGIPPLPVAVRGGGWPAEESASWKSRQLARQFDGRPLMWVDDNPPSDPSLSLPALRRPNDRALTRFQWIQDWERGITRADVGEMQEWLMLAASPEGHAELRRRRRRERDRQRAKYRRHVWGSDARYRQWRGIYNRVKTSLGPDHEPLPALLADYALDHSDLDLDQITSLASEWGGIHSPPATELIRLIRNEPRGGG